uniref:Uncharacterized protein n=1 Tax=viral metagenome TaxID=1070528 RepID=A0A6M3JZK1_9ZZZZ
MTVNLNKSDDFINEIKIFNDGNAGVVENVHLRIEKKSASDDVKKPDYKLIASDDKGEINEGFYYQVPDEKGETKGFNKYQAQHLIMLARGIFGKDIIFPVYNTPKEALDGIMIMVAPVLNNKVFRVAVTYGTNRRRSAFLEFKSFGDFIQLMSEPNTLSLGRGDSTIRDTPAPAAASQLVSDMSGVNPPNLDWMNT